jgi:hypothetical protein
MLSAAIDWVTGSWLAMRLHSSAVDWSNAVNVARNSVSLMRPW